VVKVQRVRDSDPELLRYLSEMGIKPEAQLKILDFSPFDNNLQVQIEGAGEPVVLGPRVTSQVFVEVVD
jgi:Fe2+ transport system protein FeoA